MFSCAVTRVLGVVVVTVHGSLDASSCSALEAVLADLIEGQGNLRVVVDVGDMAVVDPSCLGVLVAAADSAAGRGGEVTFAHPTDSVARALEVAGLGGAISAARRPHLQVLPPASPRGVPAAPGRTWLITRLAAPGPPGIQDHSMNPEEGAIE